MGKNIFQKMMDVLFDEVIVEEEVEETEKEELKLPPVSNVILPDQAKPVTLKEKEEPIRKEVLKKESRSTMISVDELKEPTPVKKIAVSERKSKPEYEFTQVISPIFGVIGEEPENRSESFVPNTPKKKKAMKSNSVLGTVISPIYGINREENAVNMDFELTEEEPSLTIDELIEKQQKNASLSDTSLNTEKETDPIHFEANFDSLVKTFEEEENVQKESQKRMAEGQNLSLFDDFEEHS